MTDQSVLFLWKLEPSMIYALLLLLLFIFGNLIGIPDAPFPQGDEIMHIRSVRESLSTGNYIIPTLSSLPNPYKPPLLFWMGMATDKIFGISYASERLVSVSFGIGILILLYKLVFHIGKSRGEALLTTILFGYTFFSLKFFGLLMMETAMAFFLLFYFFTFYFYKKTKQPRYLILGSIISGIGYLLKGPILHVYILLFLFSYFYVEVVKIRNGKLSFLWKKIKKERFIIFSFGITFIIPSIWILFLYFTIPSGKDLLRFFFITENIGKFYSANQSGIRIWFGWILYTIPFTIPLIHLIGNIIRIHKPTKHKNYVMVLLIYFILVTSVHLLPNRKDPYYLTPFISFLFLLPSMHNITWKSILLSKANQISNLIIYFVLSLIAVVLRLPYLFAITIILILYLSNALFFLQNKNSQWRAVFISQIFIVPCIIFLLIQPISDPDLRDLMKEAQHSSICVVTENPWTAMDVQNKLENSTVIFSLPLTIAEKCSQANYLINFVGVEIPNDFAKLKTWSRWNQHMQLNFNLFSTSNFKFDQRKFKTEISFWKRGEPI